MTGKCAPNHSSRKRGGWLTLIVFLSISVCSFAQQSISELHQAFSDPPSDSRIMMRWWWFGAAITKQEIERELEEMKASGIGGVEVATLYPQVLDDPAAGFHNVSFLSDEYIDDLRFAGEKAKALGLRMDVTLGSGWPFGGPHIPITQAAGRLRVEAVVIPPANNTILAPSLSAGESLLKVFIVPAEGSAMKLADAKSMDELPVGRFNVVPDAEKVRTALFFISSRTGMMVKRPAVGAAGFVLDHYDAQAMATHLKAVGDRLLQAFPDTPPYAVFSDSLEDYGSNWTPRLLAEFRNRRGYDLSVHLPALIGDAGPDTAAIRHDWGLTLTELANEGFLQTMHAWARQHGTLLRSQTYGFPPVTLSSNRFEDLPEGEGKATLNMWREFSDARWAASAGHLYGHNVISSETWTWLHSPAFRATPLDMKAEADLHFLQGINQLVGHGWPLSPEFAGEPGWRMYAAAALNTHNPWFFVMPDLARYLQRVSFVLRLGRPANDMALLLPNDDVWASFKVGVEKSNPTSFAGFDETGSNVSIDESMSQVLGDNVIRQVLDAGYNLDFIDADSIDIVGIPYKVLILPNIERIPEKTYTKIAEFARNGGIVIATRQLPSQAPGYLNSEAESIRIQQTSKSLFRRKPATAHFIEKDEDLATVLRSSLEPDFKTDSDSANVGFIHRSLKNGDLYFIANTSNRHLQTQAHFRSSYKHAEEWDPFTGHVSGLPDAKVIPLDLEPYESCLIFFSNDAMQEAYPQKLPATQTVDVSSGWRVTFNDKNHTTVEMPELRQWQQYPALRYYSGTASYEKTLTLERGASAVLDFGEGTSVPIPDPLGAHNMRAYLESPVREAAQVFLNGHSAGYVWHPPYCIDLTPLVKEGRNDLKIVVGNTAINALAGQSQPDYRLLNAHYGVLFVPQDMDHLEPLPSGITGPIKLIVSKPVREKAR
ncbi:glycosyl hydrolase [Acidobacterium sp. S8]|uniref:glycosyl hydrolase n=1 Tax=Acidobacterium sp. S8 TaxID=1641854 RepID=UPI00210F53B8|nr:glycosyl hydrolase [Acidobacterium sp. S8]